jgi:hypothetical protein
VPVPDDVPPRGRVAVCAVTTAVVTGVATDVVAVEVAVAVGVVTALGVLVPITSCG